MNTAAWIYDSPWPNHLHVPSAPWWVEFGIPALGFLLAALALFFALRAARRGRLVADLPTCKTTGVFIGLVELNGTAEVEEPLLSYLAVIPCVYFAWSVEEHWSRTVTETYTDSQGRTQTRTRTESGWTTVDHGGERKDFYLKDDCGVILIRPASASIEAQSVFQQNCGPADPLYYGKGPRRSVADSTHRRRFTERAIPLHAQIYIVGQARERDDVVAPEIAHNPKAELFLISTRTEAQIRRGMAWQFWLLGLFAIILGVGGLIARDTSTERRLGDFILTYSLFAAALATFWLLGWAGMAYNSLVTLRQRVRQAWSNVDVQLQRRHDLIPNLVKTVEGLRDHEQSVQTELARLRTQMSATAPGLAGPDPLAVAPVLVALAERYPNLKANNVFQGLFQNLVDTEQRLALARAYFNELASFYNARLQVVPDRFLATLARLKPQSLMTANGFERAPVEVKFATTQDQCVTPAPRA